MGKREKMITTIKNSLINCYHISSSVYSYGSVPKDKYRNACVAYAGNIEYDNVFGLIDETLFGNAKKGMLFTNDGFYASFGERFYPYAENTTFKEFPAGYNKIAIDELIGTLCGIEKEPTGWDIAGGLLDLLFDGVKEFSKIAEEVEEEKTQKEMRELLDEMLSMIETIIIRLTELQNDGKAYTDEADCSEYFDDVEEFAISFESSEFIDLAEIMDNAFDPELDNEIEPIKYKIAARKFVRRIRSAVEDFKDDTNTADETNEIIQQTLKEFRKINKQAKNNINVILEHE